MADDDRSLIPSSPYFHGGTALLAAAPVMGVSMPKAMQARADVAQKIVDRATMDGLRLQRGIGELEEAASPGLQDLAARLSRRAEAGTRMRDKALHQLATEGKILKGMGIGAGVLGAGLTAKGLYDHFHKEALDDPMKEMLGSAGLVAGGAALAKGYPHAADAATYLGGARAVRLLRDHFVAHAGMSPQQALRAFAGGSRYPQSETTRALVERGRAALTPGAPGVAELRKAIDRQERFLRALPSDGAARGAGTALAGAGLALGAKGLYDHFHKEGAAGALADLGLTKTALGMTLRFRSPEEAQEHSRIRNIAGALGGGLLGAGLGGAALGKRFGVPGAVVGGVGGAMLGSIPGKLLADTAHDYRERTVSTYDDTMQRLNAAAGGNIRVASALDEFVQFTDQDAAERQAPDSELQNASGFQLDQEKRERPPGFGPPSALAGADAGTRMMQIGLPAGGAV